MPRRRRMIRSASRRATRRMIHRIRRRMVRRTIMMGGMMVLAASGTAAAIKLSQQDAQRIQQHTGLAPQELEDQDLEQAIQELNIHPQPLTDAEQVALNSQHAPIPQGSQTNYMAELEKLGELRDKGIITDADFDAKKKQLLGL